MSPTPRYAERGWRATFYTTGMAHSPTSATGAGWERRGTRRRGGVADVEGLDSVNYARGAMLILMVGLSVFAACSHVFAQAVVSATPCPMRDMKRQR
jgi:hypothetical protein